MRSIRKHHAKLPSAPQDSLEAFEWAAQDLDSLAGRQIRMGFRENRQASNHLAGFRSPAEESRRRGGQSHQPHNPRDAQYLQALSENMVYENISREQRQLHPRAPVLPLPDRFIQRQEVLTERSANCSATRFSRFAHVYTAYQRGSSNTGTANIGSSATELLLVAAVTSCICSRASNRAQLRPVSYRLPDDLTLRDSVRCSVRAMLLELRDRLLQSLGHPPHSPRARSRCLHICEAA